MQYRCAALCAFIAAFAAGCNQTPLSTLAAPAPSVQSDGQTPTQNECCEYARELESAVRSGDPTETSSLMRLDDLMRRTVNDLDIPSRARDEILRGASSSSNKALPSELVAIVKQGGSYTFRNYHVDNGKPYVLFRMFTSRGGVTYHDIALARHPDGKVALDDIYYLSTGELVSQSLRRSLLALVPSLYPSLLAQLTAADRDVAENMKKITRLGAAVNGGRADEAIATYRSLPETLRKDKSLLLFYVRAAHLKGGAEYAAALATYRRYHPSDRALDFLELDHQVMTKDYKSALATIDRLSTVTQDDSYILVMRASVLSMSGRHREAATAAEKAIEKEPDLARAYACRLTVSLQEKNHAETLQWLKQYADKCGVTIEDLTKLPGYAEFIKSPQYAEWKNWYREHGKK